MPPRTKKRRDHSESREESLGVPGRLEARIRRSHEWVDGDTILCRYLYGAKPYAHASPLPTGSIPQTLYELSLASSKFSVSATSCIDGLRARVRHYCPKFNFTADAQSPLPLPLSARPRPFRGPMPQPRQTKTIELAPTPIEFFRTTPLAKSSVLCLLVSRCPPSFSHEADETGSRCAEEPTLQS
jgi:hypothetical protein